MNQPIKSHYLILGEKLWDALIFNDVIAPDMRNETTKEAVVELFGGFLQASAESGARYSEINARLERLMIERNRGDK